MKKKMFKIGLKFEKVTVHTVCSAKGDSISERFTPNKKMLRIVI